MHMQRAVIGLSCCAQPQPLPCKGMQCSRSLSPGCTMAGYRPAGVAWRPVLHPASLAGVLLPHSALSPSCMQPTGAIRHAQHAH